jgi:Domain of unknown function DUF29
MAIELKASQKSLYETDFAGWIEANLEQLRLQNYDRVDWPNLLEEIEDISRRERKALKSNRISGTQVTHR